MSKGYTKEQVLKAIHESGCVISIIRKNLGCKSWETARRYIDKWQETRDAFATEEKAVNDLARSVVIKDIKAGNVQTAKWWLAIKERQEFGEQGEQQEQMIDDTELTINIIDGVQNED